MYPVKMMEPSMVQAGQYAPPMGSSTNPPSSQVNRNVGIMLITRTQVFFVNI